MKFAEEVPAEEALAQATTFFLENDPIITLPKYENPTVAWASEHAWAGLRNLSEELDPMDFVVTAFFQAFRDIISLIPALVEHQAADPRTVMVTINALSTLPQVILRYAGSETTMEDLAAFGIVIDTEGEEL